MNDLCCIYVLTAQILKVYLIFSIIRFSVKKIIFYTDPSLGGTLINVIPSTWNLSVGSIKLMGLAIGKGDTMIFLELPQHFIDSTGIFKTIYKINVLVLYFILFCFFFILECGYIPRQHQHHAHSFRIIYFTEVF